MSNNRYELWRTRRQILRVAGGATAGSILIVQSSNQSTAQTDESWNQFGFNAANTGYTPNNTGPTDNVVERLNIKVSDNGIDTSPAVVNNTIYVGTNTEALYALDAVDGTTIWEFDTDGRVQSSPAVVNGTTYFGSEDNTVYALDASDGNLQWKFETDDSVESSPSIIDDTVYIGNDEGRVYALDASEGDERWHFDTKGQIVSAPAVAGGTAYIGTTDGNVHAVDTSDGSEQWKFESRLALRSAPTVASETLYIGSLDNNVYALNTSDGSERWQFTTDHSVWSSPAVADNALYVGSLDHNVYALDKTDGTEIWRFETGGPVESSPVITENTVYVASRDTGVYAINRSSGNQQWSFMTSGSLFSSPSVAMGSVYVGNIDGTMYALTDEAGMESISTATEVPEQSNGEGTDALPFLLGLGVAGLGSGGAYWWTKRNSGSADHEESDGDITTSGGNTTSLSSQQSISRSVKDRPDDKNIPKQIPSAPSTTVQYEVLKNEEPIGGGGNADVTKATFSTPDGEVTLAIKEPRMLGTLHTDHVERMLQEAETWNKLDDHNHIVGVVDYGSEPIPWIAMEYMDGGHLGERSGGMEIPQALWTALAVMKGVRHAHTRGVAHLDLKPENVLFRTVADAWDVPKVADWGLSKHLLEHSKSVEGMSPHYAAPEQFDEEYGPADNVTDVYQLGAVFYELFTGQPPFEGRPTKVMRAVMDEQPTPPSEIADVPKELDDILLKALAKEKSDRYDDILYLRDNFQDLFDDY